MRTISVSMLSRSMEQRREYLVRETGGEQDGGDLVRWYNVVHADRAGSDYDVRCVFDVLAPVFLPRGMVLGTYVPCGCNCKYAQTNTNKYCKHMILVMLTTGLIAPSLREKGEKEALR